MSKMTQEQLAARWQMSPRTLEQRPLAGQGAALPEDRSEGTLSRGGCGGLGGGPAIPKHLRSASAGARVMARLPSPNRIKTHQVYTVWEAALGSGPINLLEAICSA